MTRFECCCFRCCTKAGGESGGRHLYQRESTRISKTRTSESYNGLTASPKNIWEYIDMSKEGFGSFVTLDLILINQYWHEISEGEPWRN
ncbi:hypothetical protein P3S67_005610 [Capsicum chacoense]